MQQTAFSQEATTVDILRERLRVFMREKKLTAPALEKLCGVPASTINNILGGRSNDPGITTVYALAKGMECDINELIRQDAHLASLELPRAAVQPDVEKLMWEGALFKDILKEVDSLLKTKNKALTLGQVLYLVKQSYAFSFKERDKKVDEGFIAWLIDTLVR